MPSAKEQLLAPAITAIGQHFTDNDLTVSRLAHLCGISETYLRRLFCDRFGMGPKEYVIERRLSYAVRLLESGQFSVGEIAGMCGYAEPCHFSREFSRRYGMSPNEYKNRHRR
jgi:AraC-like DNA-binding protein